MKPNKPFNLTKWLDKKGEDNLINLQKKQKQEEIIKNMTNRIKEVLEKYKDAA